MTRRWPGAIAAALTLAATLTGTNPAEAQSMAFRQAVAEGVSVDDGVAAFYRQTRHDDLWTGPDDLERRAALLAALESAGDHGLPMARYDPAALRAAFARADTPRARGEAEALASLMFVRYADDVQSGILEPGEVDDDLVLTPPRVGRDAQLAAFADANPRAYIAGLPPRHPHYIRLQRYRLDLIETIAQGGWGPRVTAGSLGPGDAGPGVVDLRNRLIAMGYLGRSATAEYGMQIEEAVRAFQEDMDLEPDGVAGPGTLAAINQSPEERLGQILVAMERQRWINDDLGARHVLVNVADFMAYVVDDYEVTFETRTVVGARASDRRTPEFSDVMEHIVINPTWTVPWSIAVNEYLPSLQANRYAAGHLQVLNSRGQAVDRSQINFARYSRRTFPFVLRQPPGPSNALGEVKFIFPNDWNIYLHDTPSRHLFDREVRAYSHGCIRVHRPRELAYHLLAAQEDDPEAFYAQARATGQETFVYLDDEIPVHLVYWTTWIDPDGGVNLREDVYGRNARIWQALQAAGVETAPVSG